MSRTLMQQKDIPQYVRDNLSRLKSTLDTETTGIYGYTYRLYGQYRVGYESKLYTLAEKIVKWAQRYYADSYIVNTHFWDTDIPVPNNSFRGDKSHRRKAYRDNYHNYITLVITDPVAKMLEIAKCNARKQEKGN